MVAGQQLPDDRADLPAGQPAAAAPLVPDDIKPRLLGHWGTSPGLSFVYTHMSRVIRHTGQETIYLTGPGHGGPALVAAGYLEGTYSEIYPKVTSDADGVRRLFRQFSAPGGIPSHVSVTTPGSIHEGGELGYVLVHAFGAVMDNPDLLALAVVGDGEAETGPLEGSWKGISFLNPARDGAVLPVLHLNGAKIAGPTVLAARTRPRCAACSRATATTSWRSRVTTVRACTSASRRRSRRHTAGSAASSGRRATATGMGGARGGRSSCCARPKGWTGPDEVDGIQVHRHVALAPGAAVGGQGQPRAPRGPRDVDAVLSARGALRRVRPAERHGPASANPEGDLRMSASPHANGGVLTAELDIPDFRDYARDVPAPGTVREESTRADR